MLTSVDSSLIKEVTESLDSSNGDITAIYDGVEGTSAGEKVTYYRTESPMSRPGDRCTQIKPKSPPPDDIPRCSESYAVNEQIAQSYVMKSQVFDHFLRGSVNEVVLNPIKPFCATCNAFVSVKVTIKAEKLNFIEKVIKSITDKLCTSCTARNKYRNAVHKCAVCRTVLWGEQKA